MYNNLCNPLLLFLLSLSSSKLNLSTMTTYILLPILLLSLFFSIASSHQPGPNHPNPNPNDHPKPDCDTNKQHHPLDPVITSICNHAKYPDICVSSIQSHPPKGPADPPAVLSSLIHGLIDVTTHTRDEAKHTLDSGGLQGAAAKVVSDCRTAYDNAIHSLEMAKGAAARKDKMGALDAFREAMNKYEGCERGFMEMPGTVSLVEQNEMLSKMVENCLSMMEKV